MNGGVLQFFLLLNAFLIGSVSVFAYRHARAHFWPHKHDAEKKPEPPVKLPPALREQLLAEASTHYKKILDDAAGQLQLDLSKTTASLNRDLAVLGNQIISDEMKRYRNSLDELQKHTESAIESTQTELDRHQDDLKVVIADKQKELLARMNEAVEVEKQHLLEQIDTKLADAAASFLLETLQHDVDLGAQVPYMTKMIEEHKEEFKKEVSSGDSTSQ